MTLISASIVLALAAGLALSMSPIDPSKMSNFHMGFGKRMDPTKFHMGFGKRMDPTKFHMGFGKRMDPTKFHMGFGKRMDPTKFHMGFGKRMDPTKFHMGFGKRMDPTKFHMGFGKRNFDMVPVEEVDVSPLDDGGSIGEEEKNFNVDQLGFDRHVDNAYADR